MSQTYQIPDAAVSETPLASQLATLSASLNRIVHRGTRTPLRFSDSTTEISALLHHTGVFDQGYRTWLRATGKDRVRWLNGMLTQAVKSMSPGQAAYTLILNPQGRIQGDGTVLCFEDFLLLETDHSQSERLLTHLRRFIIMDDVKLDALDAETTALGIAGPEAHSILARLGISAPVPDTFSTSQLAGVPVTLVHEYGPVVPHFSIHLPAQRVTAVWNTLLAAGAIPCGIEAIESLRVLEGTPMYGVDFSEKHLPQETNLQRALNFTKGCYIGQEIVERIRSRASIHRSLRQFELRGKAPERSPGRTLELRASGIAVGELTSLASFALPGFSRNLALGVIRVEALEKIGTEPIRYDGGTAVPLVSPPDPRTS